MATMLRLNELSARYERGRGAKEAPPVAFKRTLKSRAKPTLNFFLITNCYPIESDKKPPDLKLVPRNESLSE